MAELLSTKRSSRLRSLKTWFLLGLLASASLFIAYLLYRRVSSYPHPHESLGKAELSFEATDAPKGLRFGEGSLRFEGQLAILQTVGKAYAQGVQQGRLRADSIRAVFESLQPSVAATVSRSGFLGDLLHRIRLRWRWRSLDEGIPGHQLFELSGLVRGAGSSGHTLDYENLVRQSAVFDLGRAAPSASHYPDRRPLRALTLLAPIQGPFARGLLVARTLSVPGVVDGGASLRTATQLHISRPEKGLASASLGWAGLSGVVSGVNEKGLGIFVHTVDTADTRLTREAQPVALAAKEVLESASELTEAVELLQKVKLLSGASFIVVSGKKREWAVVERSWNLSEVRFGTGPYAGVDSLDARTFAEDPVLERSLRRFPLEDRRSRAQSLLQKNLSSAADIAEILRDNKGADGTALPLGSRAAIDTIGAIQCAIFDPGAMVLWVSESGDSHRRFQSIDLQALLSDRPGKNAPPSAIPAVAEDLAARDGVLRTREQLRLARRLHQRGKLNLAREQTALGLARSPNLPEALHLAGELARLAGEDLDARAYFQRYLEVGADDLGAQEQARAWLGL